MTVFFFYCIVSVFGDVHKMCMKSAAALKIFFSLSYREMVVLNENVVRFAIDVDNFTFVVWEKKQNIWLNEKKSNKKTCDFFCVNDWLLRWWWNGGNSQRAQKEPDFLELQQCKSVPMREHSIVAEIFTSEAFSWKHCENVELEPSPHCFPTYYEVLSCTKSAW